MQIVIGNVHSGTIGAVAAALRPVNTDYIWCAVGVQEYNAGGYVGDAFVTINSAGSITYATSSGTFPANGALCGSMWWIIA